MNFPVHFLSGVLLAEAALISYGIPLEPTTFLNEISNFSGPLSEYSNSLTASAIAISATCLLGSIFPDIDIKLSFTQHRTLTHWPILYIVLGVFAIWYSNLYLILFSIGALIHLGLDSLTPMGIPIKHPFGRRFSFFLVRSDNNLWDFVFSLGFGIAIFFMYLT